MSTFVYVMYVGLQHAITLGGRITENHERGGLFFDHV